MTLSDLENCVLTGLSMPYSNFGGTVVWGGEFPQNKVDFAINRGYTNTIAKLADLTLVTATLKFPSVSGQYRYSLQAPNATPPIAIGSYATAGVQFSGVVALGQSVSITINGVLFTVTITGAMVSIPQVINAFITMINESNLVQPAGTILSPVNQALNGQSQLTLMAGLPGTAGNAITLSATSSTVYGSEVLGIEGGGILGTQGLGEIGLESGIAETLTLTVTPFSGGTAANQPIQLVRRVTYQALGQLFSLELEPGARLISWEEFNRKTGAGYLLPFSFTTWPDYCAVSTKRDSLYFYGAPSEYGDLITVEYAPIITTNTAIPASSWGYLVNETDLPLLPEDTQDAIWLWAVGFLQPNAREYATGKTYMQLWTEKIQEIRDNYTRDSAGDAQILRPVSDALVTSGYGAFLDF